MKSKNRRTEVNWKEHEVIYKEDSYSKIWELRKPNSCIDLVCFINVGGILAVTGDYGNWIFHREFHPSAEGFVCDDYWHEKLQIASRQTGSEYNADETRKSIVRALNGGLEEDYEGDDLETMREYLEMCLHHVEDELDYSYHAYHQAPSFLECESIIFCKKPVYWLSVVFDAFDEICRRIKLEERKYYWD